MSIRDCILARRYLTNTVRRMERERVELRPADAASPEEVPKSPGPSSPPIPTSGSGRRGAAHPAEQPAGLASGALP